MSYATLSAFGEDYSAIVSTSIPSLLPAGDEGRLASVVLSSVVNKQQLPVANIAAEAAGVAATAALAPYAGPLAPIAGALVNGAVSDILGGGGSDCDEYCVSKRDGDLISHKICIDGSGKVDPSCQYAVYQATLYKWQSFWNFFKASLQMPLTPAFVADFNAKQIRYGVPPGLTQAEANERIYQARLREIAAQRILQNDISWANNVVNVANATSSEWGPRCPSSPAGTHAACVSQVKGVAIQYALNANPFRQVSGSPVVGSVALSQLTPTMLGVTGMAQGQSDLFSGQAKSAASDAARSGISVLEQKQKVLEQKQKDRRNKTIAIAAFGTLVLAAVAYVLVDD